MRGSPEVLEAGCPLSWGRLVSGSHWGQRGPGSRCSPRPGSAKSTESGPVPMPPPGHMDPGPVLLLLPAKRSIWEAREPALRIRLSDNQKGLCGEQSCAPLPRPNQSLLRGSSPDRARRQGALWGSSCNVSRTLAGVGPSLISRMRKQAAALCTEAPRPDGPPSVGGRPVCPEY